MSRIFEEIVRKRGIGESFLRPKYSCERVDLPDIDKAVKRIKQAVKKHEKVLIYGDYDVDGVTATTVMKDALELAGITEVEMMLPDRFVDGYGMSMRVVGRAEEVGAKLVVTVDCGSNNAEVIEELRKIGVDAIVTDHHEVMGEIPNAVAVVNPKRDDAGELRELAGVGVAFMLAKALVQEGLIPDGQEKWMLDLVLIGTVCDSMRLTGVNRELCFFGIKVLEKTRRPGLIELMRVAKVSRIDTYAIGYQLGPRLNAGGRMESAEISLKLLNTKSRSEAARLATKLDQLNTNRRAEQRDAVREIEKMSEETEKNVIVVAGDWHEGVLGIIAGRLVEQYKKPAFVLSEVDEVVDVNGDGMAEKEKIYKGSGRSFGDFNLAEALKACGDEIIGGGGHAAACGVKIHKSKLSDFKRKINEYYDSLKLKEQEKYLEAKPEVVIEDLSEVKVELLDELALMEPFGEGNEEPVFEIETTILNMVQMGTEGKHLRIDVWCGEGKVLKLVAFNALKDWFELCRGQRYRFFVRLARNEWQGQVNVEGVILGVGN